MRIRKALLCVLLCACLLLPALGERGEVIIEQNLQEMDSDLPLKGKKIGIDPGHQLHADSTKEPIAPGSSETKARVAGGTRGVSTGRPEHATNLEVALLLKELLEELGAEVLMTRETADVNVSNMERALMMNEWGADAVLRLHCNGNNVQSVHGMGMYIRKTGQAAEESERLARCLLTCMSRRTGAKAQGIYKRDSYTGLNWSTVPCVLVEMGYMTNPDEDKKLNDPLYQEQIVLGIAEALIDYFETPE